MERSVLTHNKEALCRTKTRNPLWGHHQAAPLNQLSEPKSAGQCKRHLAKGHGLTRVTVAIQAKTRKAGRGPYSLKE